MIRELVILEMLDSPNIIRVYEFIRTKKNFYMIQEFANGGSLQSLLEIKGRFEEATAKKLLK
jgi:calcium-dependent protein kinase